jgi:hypothetical protein
MGPPGAPVRWVLGSAVGSPRHVSGRAGRQRWDSGRSAWLRCARYCGPGSREPVCGRSPSGRGWTARLLAAMSRQPEAEGLTREAGVAAHRPAGRRGAGAGASGTAERARRSVATAARTRQAGRHVGHGRHGRRPGPVSIVKIEELLARQGCVVPYRTLHRFAVERCGFRVKGTTVRIADGEPGVDGARRRPPMGRVRSSV